MPKPPRGQSPREGAASQTWQRSKARTGTRKSDSRDRHNDTPKEQRAEPREKAALKPKKPGWAKASPRKTPHWRAKSKKQHGLRPDQATDSAHDDRSAAKTRGQRPLRSSAMLQRDTVESTNARARPERRSVTEQNERPSSSRRTHRTPVAQESDRPSPRSGRRTPQHTQNPGDGAPTTKMRIAKAMARAGLCSRRDAERWIEDGRVEVNGEKIASPARDVGPGDRILIDGKPLPTAEPARLWRYSKPRGVVTTHRDPEGRPTVFDNLPDDMPRVLSIGRLDYNTEGLLLLTTDGELARHLELPSTGWLRRYRVRARGRVDQADLDALKDGHTVDGVHYGPIEATLDSQQGANMWLTVALREGKNREVRNILASLGLEVNRLIRVSYGPFQLLDMKPGTVEQVRRKVLVEQLGARLSAQFDLEDDDEESTSTRPITSKRPARDAASRRQKPSPDQPKEPRKRTGGTRGNSSASDSRAPAQAPHRAKTTSRQDRPRPGSASPRSSQRPPSEFVEVDETKLDDIKPWQIETGGPARAHRQRPNKKSGSSTNATRSQPKGKSSARRTDKRGNKQPTGPERS